MLMVRPLIKGGKTGIFKAVNMSQTTPVKVTFFIAPD